MQTKKELNNKICNEAKKVMLNAYAPYSKFSVGASLLTKNGKIFSGCNVENSSFGLTVCAERIAIFNAVASGEKDFVAIAITTSDNKIITPCGACLQVMSEFNPKLKLVLFSKNRNKIETTLDKIFPSPPELKKLSKK